MARYFIVLRLIPGDTPDASSTPTTVPLVTAGFPPPQPPIHGAFVTPAVDGSDTNNFPTSLVYHMDKMANPDIIANPGDIEGIRRMGAIHVFVALFFENYAVSLCPGVTGKASDTGLKGLNGRLRPLYDAYRIPAGFSNSLYIAAASLPWGGREREDSRIAKEAEFRPWAHPEFGRYQPPATWGWRSVPAHRITSKHGALRLLICPECSPVCMAMSGYKKESAPSGNWELRTSSHRANILLSLSGMNGSL